eukprot:TRINITY_DN5366_c0_g1_i2.p1 TRINITY_DN5366_c0_g1~~TRINITY_DN5366_c0_g1_i2.p1  ORF type:complete len:639 (+),score=103.11 TRINITY_DN5366_c0_g1_i2:142-2058(+)
MAHGRQPILPPAEPVFVLAREFEGPNIKYEELMLVEIPADEMARLGSDGQVWKGMVRQDGREPIFLPVRWLPSEKSGKAREAAKDLNQLFALGLLGKLKPTYVPNPIITTLAVSHAVVSSSETTTHLPLDILDCWIDGPNFQEELLRLRKENPAEAKLLAGRGIMMVATLLTAGRYLNLKSLDLNGTNLLLHNGHLYTSDFSKVERNMYPADSVRHRDQPYLREAANFGAYISKIFDHAPIVRIFRDIVGEDLAEKLDRFCSGLTVCHEFLQSDCDGFHIFFQNLGERADIYDSGHLPFDFGLPEDISPFDYEDLVRYVAGNYLYAGEEMQADYNAGGSTGEELDDGIEYGVDFEGRDPLGQQMSHDEVDIDELDGMAPSTLPAKTHAPQGEGEGERDGGGSMKDDRSVGSGGGGDQDDEEEDGNDANEGVVEVVQADPEADVLQADEKRVVPKNKRWLRADKAGISDRMILDMSDYFFSLVRRTSDSLAALGPQGKDKWKVLRVQDGYIEVLIGGVSAEPEDMENLRKIDKAIVDPAWRSLSVPKVVKRDEFNTQVARRVVLFLVVAIHGSCVWSAVSRGKSQSYANVQGEGENPQVYVKINNQRFKRGRIDVVFWKIRVLSAELQQSLHRTIPHDI